MTIPIVSTYSGQRSWKCLERYTEFTCVGDHFADWKWSPAIEKAAKGLADQK
jgi:hypothetical protein